jgi:hypothetical protein
LTQKKELLKEKKTATTAVFFCPTTCILDSFEYVCVTNIQSVMPTDFITPTKAMIVYDLSRGKFYQLVRDGYFKLYRLPDGGSKRYARMSEIEKIFTPM